MKILAINWRDPFHPEAGGAEIHLDKILSFLAENHDVTLISTKTSRSPEEYTHNGYTVKKIGHPFLFNFHFFFLWQNLKKENYDLIIDDISKIGCATPLYIKDTPIIGILHHIHGRTVFQILPFLIALYVYLIERLALYFYQKTPLVVVSNSTKEELLTLGEFIDITVLHNGIDDVFLEQHKISKIPNQLCIIGRLAPYKRLDLALQTFSKIHANIPNATLLIAGKGIEEHNLKAQIKSLGLSDVVHFEGYISEERKLEILRTSEAFLFTSEKEGWGIAAIESSASQTPVFGFNVAGLCDSVQQGINGILVDEYGDTDLLAKLVCAYLTQDFEKQKLQAQALCYAKNFNWKTITKEFELLCLMTSVQKKGKKYD